MGAPFLLAEGAPHILRGRRNGRKRAFQCQKSASSGGRGGLSAWKGSIAGEIGIFSCQKGALDGGRAPI